MKTSTKQSVLSLMNSMNSLLPIRVTILLVSDESALMMEELEQLNEQLKNKTGSLQEELDSLKVRH